MKRALAYEQAIAQPREAAPEATEASAKDEEITAFETVTTPQQADVADEPVAMPDLPPDEDAGVPQDVAALPGDDQLGTDGAEQWGDERDQSWAHGSPRLADPYGPPPADPYGDPYAAQDPYGPPPGDPYDPYAAQDPYGPPPGDPYGQQADPYGQQAGAWGDENAEEWVQVIISGAPMRATAAEDAPMLFAFPYGRSLKVVSRFEGWVEVTDPKSAAVGWMQAHSLGPSRAPGQTPYGQTGAYYDEQPRERPGLFQRGGFSDMINRAFGGGH